MGKTGRKGQKRVMVSSDHFTLLVFFFLYRGIINPSYLGIMISQQKDFY